MITATEARMASAMFRHDDDLEAEMRSIDRMVRSRDGLCQQRATHQTSVAFR